MASTNILPVAVPINIGRKTVTSGIAEFLITWRNNIFLSLNPFALKTVTKGLFKVSSIADRVYRA